MARLGTLILRSGRSDSRAHWNIFKCVTEGLWRALSSVSDDALNSNDSGIHSSLCTASDRPRRNSSAFSTSSLIPKLKLNKNYKSLYTAIE